MSPRVSVPVSKELAVSVLANLYRAKGDFAGARQTAEKSGNSALSGKDPH